MHQTGCIADKGIILFSLKTIALPKAEVSRLRAASAASIVAAKGRSFRLTRSAFSLSPLARRRPLETFGAVFLLLCFNAAQHNTVFILND